MNGSFNPITIGHIQLMEHAVKYINNQNCYQIVKCIFSPVPDCYPFKQVIKAQQRQKMIELAIQNSIYKQLFEINTDELYSQNWLKTYESINMLSEKYQPNKIFFVCGADFIKGMLDTKYWLEENLKKFFNKSYVLCFLRSKGQGSVDQQELFDILQNKRLNPYKQQIQIIFEEIGNMSSRETRSGNLSFLYDNVKEYYTNNVLNLN